MMQPQTRNHSSTPLVILLILFVVGASVIMIAGWIAIRPGGGGGTTTTTSTSTSTTLPCVIVGPPAPGQGYCSTSTTSSSTYTIPPTFITNPCSVGPGCISTSTSSVSSIDYTLPILYATSTSNNGLANIVEVHVYYSGGYDASYISVSLSDGQKTTTNVNGVVDFVVSRTNTDYVFTVPPELTPSKVIVHSGPAYTTYHYEDQVSSQYSQSAFGFFGSTSFLYAVVGIVVLAGIVSAFVLRFRPTKTRH